MILQSLIGTCFFAGIVAILSIPWIIGSHEENSAHSERHH
jgi:hypothetical protein